MSKIEDLIKQYCPDGVEWKHLYEVTVWDKRFNSVERYKQPTVIDYKKYFLGEEQKQLVSDGGSVKILTTYASNLYADENSVADYITDGEIVCIPWGGNAIVQYYKGKFVTGDNRIATSLDVNVLSNKYLYYMMQCNLHLIASFYRGSGIKHPDMSKVLDILIPIPPRPVQDEIVRILDKFTELEKELEKELELRRKQYEFYRDKLLTFDGGVEQYGITEIFDLRNGYTPSKSVKEYWENGTVDWFRMEDIREHGNVLSEAIQKVSESAVKGGKKIKANSIALATTATIGEHALIIVDCLGNQRFTFFTKSELFFDKVNMDFMNYYFFKIDEWCKTHTRQGNFASVDMDALKQLKIPVPSPTEQEHIVKILDKFDTLTTSLTSGLPAEIKLRKQQYEYYRDYLFGLLN